MSLILETDVTMESRREGGAEIHPVHDTATDGIIDFPTNNNNYTLLNRYSLFKCVHSILTTRFNS